MSGTTANLKPGDTLSVKHLLYGMMLPSGNDAAQALGIYFGLLLLNNGKVDPNLALTTTSESIDKKLREIKIQEAYLYGRKQFRTEKKQALPKRYKKH